VNTKKHIQDIIDVLKKTDLCSTVFFAYSLLLKPANLENHLQRSKLPVEQENIILVTLDLFNLIGRMDVKLLQVRNATWSIKSINYKFHSIP